MTTRCQHKDGDRQCSLLRGHDGLHFLRTYAPEPTTKSVTREEFDELASLFAEFTEESGKHIAELRDEIQRLKGRLDAARVV